MAETVRDLTVRLAFEHGDTKSQIAAIKNEIKLLETDFAAAAASAGGFSAGLNETAARSRMLQQQIALQEQAVQKYNTAIQAQQEKISAAQKRQQQYTERISQAREKQSELATEIDRVKAAMEQQAAATGKDSAEYQALAQELDNLQNELSQTESAIKDWDRGFKNASSQISKADREIQRLTIAQNESRAAIGRMQQSLDQQNSRLEQNRARLREAAQAMQDYGEKAKQAGEWQERVGSAMNKTTAAIVGAGVASAGAAIQWESSCADVEKTVSGTAEQLAKIESSLLEMSQTKPVDNTVLADIAANAGQLGIWTDNVVEFTGVMSDLSATTNLTAENGASAFAKFANITGMAQKEFDRMGSTVVALGNNMATTESDIVNMATGIASAGHQVGMTEAQILGVAAGLSSLGLEAQAGGTAFSKLLVNMQVAVETGSEDLKKYAEVAGMTAEQFKVAFGSDAAGAVTSFINGLSTGSKSAIAILDEMGISETRFRDMLLRTANASSLFSGAIDMANQAWEENTALANEAAVRYGTTASKMTMLGNKAKTAAINFGNELKPLVSTGVEWASEMLDKFNQLDSEQRKQIMTWAAYVAAIGPTISLIGKANSGIGTLATKMGKLTAAAAEAGGGFGGFASAIKSLLGPMGVAALAVAAGVMVYKFADWASGAKAAREATEALMDTAKAWKETQATTIYDQGSTDPLSRFGMSKDSFSTLKFQSEDWLQELITVWTDGKKETDEIVSHFVDSFTSGSDTVRQQIENRGSLLEGLDALDDGTKAKMDADLKLLEDYDAEVEALLKKRQNGFLTSDEEARLSEVIQLRADLQLEYGGADLSAYEQIIQGMQAEIDRMMARGMGENADPSLYADTLNALAEGRDAYNATLDASYNSQHAQIMAIQDETQRTQALAALNAQYNQQRLQGEQAYRSAVQQAAAQAWEAGGYTEQIDQIDALAAMLGDLENIDPVSMAEFTQGLDEGKLASMISMVEQLKESGMSDADLAGMGIYYDDLMSKLTQIRDTAAQIEGMDGIASMFGEALPEEIQRIMVGLDMTQAAEDWAAFMEGKDPFEASGKLTLSEIDETAIANWQAANASTPIQGPPVKLALGLGDNWQSALQTAFDSGMLAVYGADGLPVTVTPEVLATLDAGDVMLLGEDGTLHVIITPDVDPASQPKVSIVLNPLDQAAISAWEAANSSVELNGPTAKVGVGLGANWQSDLQTAFNNGMLAVYGADGLPVTVTPEVLAKISANDVAAVEEDGTIHVLITPKVGTSEAVEMTTSAMNSTPLDNTPLSFLSSSAQEDIDRINGIAAAAAELRTQIDGLKNSGQIWTEDGLGLSELENMEDSNISYLTEQLQGLSEMDLQAISNQAANLMAALASDDLDPAAAEQYRAQLQSILDLVATADQYLGTGNQVSAGIAAGMQQYSWSGDAATLATSIRSAIDASLGVASPARSMYPTGYNTAAGIAEGMQTYSYAAVCTSVCAGIVRSYSGLPAQGKSIGSQFGAGLAAGLNAKLPGIVAKARAAANQIAAAFRSAWQIHSPSRVAQNLTEMFGAGLEKGMDKWPTVSQRMLENDMALAYGYSLRAADVIGSTTNNNNNSVNLNVEQMNVSDRQDAEALAYEIADLSRRRNMGRGLR